MARKKGMATAQIPVEYQTLYADIRQLIVEARSTVIKQVNQTLTITYWQIGKQIQTQVLDNNRAEYGKQTIQQLSQQLSDEFGKGFTYSSLTRMAKFYQTFLDKKIIATLSQQLSWSHFVELIKLDNAIQREFYAQMSSHEGWSVRTGWHGMLFERSAIAILLCSSKDKEVIELMELEQDAIHVSEYWLQLPPKEVLQAKLHKAIEEAKLRLEVGDE